MCSVAWTMVHGRKLEPTYLLSWIEQLTEHEAKRIVGFNEAVEASFD